MMTIGVEEILDNRLPESEKVDAAELVQGVQR